jgi:hypothetical protein
MCSLLTAAGLINATQFQAAARTHAGIDMPAGQQLT